MNDIYRTGMKFRKAALHCHGFTKKGNIFYITPQQDQEKINRSKVRKDKIKMKFRKASIVTRGDFISILKVSERTIIVFY